jgi:hypothetical protein
VASRGWRGFAAFGAKARQRRYWLEVPVLLLGAAWLPFQLYRWTPRVGSFGMEMTSFVLRLGAAYLLFIAAWLLLVRVSAAATTIAKNDGT